MEFRLEIGYAVFCMGQAEDLTAIENNIARLKKDYDQYFLGFEKRPPDKLRQQVEREVRDLIGFRSPNTSLKFRAQTLVQRMATYRQLWDRTLQQIEDGKFKRDIFRANLKERARTERAASGGAGAYDEVIEDAELFEEEPPKKPWGNVFDAYLKARGQTKESTSGLTYEKLHDVLEKQAAQIREKFKAKDVEFKVVIEDGKARLKATPKK